MVQLAIGEFSAVAAAAAEVLDIARATNQPNQRALPLAQMLLVRALRGEDGVSEGVTAIEELLAEHPAGVLDVLVRDTLAWALSIEAGDPASRLYHLQRIEHPVMARIAVIDRIDAAIRAGRSEQAAAEVEDLRAYSEGTGAAWAKAAVEHGLALLADGADVEPHFRAALATPDNSRRFNRARTELAIGEYLRRSRRRIEAREHLRLALSEFEILGARRWAQRAADELRASGEAVRSRRQHPEGGGLTAQEIQVARLVQQGLPNKEVAARLFVSKRTVDFHLRNVYSKLGISSRVALVQVDLDAVA